MRIGRHAMKRRILALVTALCSLVFALCLSGCSSSNGASDNSSQEAPEENVSADVLENDNMTVEGAYIDESYAGSDADEDVKRLYIFTEITASSGTLEISSASFNLSVSRDGATDSLSSMDVIQYDTDGGSTLTTLASSYTCTNVITKIHPGSSAKLIIPFNVPSYYLQEGATFNLGGPNGVADNITFGFGFIQNAENPESIAQLADSEGYTTAMTAREDASPEVAQDVMNRLNGYEYYQSKGSLMQKYSFEGNRFVASAAGLENPGTYTVKNGYLACTQDSTGWVTWIPWEASDTSENGINLDIGESFTEK